MAIGGSQEAAALARTTKAEGGGTMTLDELIAIEQIKHLKAQYFYHVDSKNWDGLGALFTDDCRFELEEAPELFGPAAFLETIKPHISDAITVHHGHDPVIDITGPDSATGRWAMEDISAGRPMPPIRGDTGRCAASAIIGSNITASPGSGGSANSSSRG